jgi:hypothetical protein
MNAAAAATSGRESGLDGPLRGMAIGRLVLGALARVSPDLTSRLSGAGPSPGGEFDYMTRVFGARAIALGTGYLASSGDARRLWQRAAFFCDISDTVAGAAQLRNREMPLVARVWLLTLTGTYAAIGAARIVEDMRASG